MQDQQQLLRPNRQNRNHSKKTSLVLPQIPDKLYFTIGEVSKLCLLEPHVLRYWEQEFPQLSPAKRRGNRRYYKHNEIILVRRIKDLLYNQGFTIEGARIKLDNDKDKSASEPATSVQLAEFMKDVIARLKQVIVLLEH